MKRLIKFASLLAMPITILASCSKIEPIKDIIQRNDANEQSEMSSTIKEGVSSFFASGNNIQFSSTKTYGYSSNTSYIVDAVSSTTRVNQVKDADGNTIEQTYYVKNGSYAQRQYLDITNTVQGEDTTISFDTLTGNPFSFITSSNVDKCFIATNNGDNYVLTPTEYGLSKISKSFNSFFPSDDSYTYDTRTLDEYVSDFKMNVNSLGVPTSMTFTKVKEDMFGAVREFYTSNMEKLAQVKSLQKMDALTSGATYEKLQTALETLNTNMADANFTQSVTTDMWVYDSSYNVGYTSVSYKSYYQFDKAYSLMVSDLALEEETYGRTFTGVVKDSNGNYEWVGISPSSNYMSALSDDDDSYDEYAQFVPSIGTVSSDFFSYDQDANTYTFDILSMLMADHSFQLELLKALVGGGDYLAMKYGNYISSTSTMKFDFDKFVIYLDVTNQISKFELSYNGLDNAVHTTTVSFSDFGTTDIANVAALSGVYSTIKANV